MVGVFTPPKTLLAFLEIPPLAFVGSVGYIPPDSTLGTTAYGGRYYAGKTGLGTKDKMVDAAKALMEKLG